MGGFNQTLGTLGVGIESTFDSKGFDAIDKGLADLDKQLAAVEKDIADFSNKAAFNFERLGEIGEGMEKAGKSMSLSITAPLTALAAYSLKASSDFESAMNKVSAQGDITGASLKQLAAQAEDLGAKTQFSSKEAADGMKELASAGFNASQIMQAMPGTMQLAAVAETSVADAAKIAKDVLAEFGLTADQTQRVVDVMAKTSTEGSSTLRELGTAMQYVGPVAHTLGLSVEQTNAALIALDQAGIRGEKAGTGLRGMLTSLISPSKGAAETMQALGVSTTDSAGKMLPFNDIIEQFRVKLAAVPGEAQRAADVVAVFGKQGQTAAQILINQGGPALDQFEEKLKNSAGTAQRVADTMNQGLAGAMERMKGSIETAAQKIGDVLSPYMVSLAGNIDTATQKATEFARWFQTLPEPIQTTTIALGGFAALLGPTLLVAGKFAQAISSIGLAMEAFTKLTGLSTLALGGWAAALTVGVAAVGTLVYAYSQMRTAQADAGKSQQNYTDSIGILESRLKAHGADIRALQSDYRAHIITQDEYAKGLRTLAIRLGDVNKPAADAAKAGTDLSKVQAQIAAAVGKSTDATKDYISFIEKAAKSDEIAAEFSRQLNAEHQKHISTLVTLKLKLDDLAKTGIPMLQPSQELNDSIQKLSASSTNLSGAISGVQNPVIQFEANVRKLGAALDSTTDKQKTAAAEAVRTARDYYAEVVSSGVATAREKDDALLKLLLAEKAQMELNHQVIPDLMRQTIAELGGMDTKPVETAWDKAMKRLQQIFEDFKRNLAGGLVKALIGDDRRAFNDQLDEQMADLQKSLADRAKEWQQDQTDTAAEFAKITADHQKSLDDMAADLAKNIADRTKDYQDYAVEVGKNIDEIKDKHATELAEENKELEDRLADKEKDYADYAVEVAKNIDEISQKWADKLAEDQERLRDSLRDRTQDYEDFVQDAQQKLDRLRQDTATNVSRETDDTADNIADRQRDYDRFAEDAADKIAELRQKNKGQYSKEENDVEKSLQRKAEDLRDYIDEQNKRLERYKQDQQLRLQREEQDHKESLERKKRDYDEFAAANAEAQAKALTDYQEGLDKEIGKQQESLDKRKAALDQFRIDTAASIEANTAKHAQEQDKEIAKQQESLDKKKAALDTYVTDASAKYETDRANANAKYDEQVSDLNAALQKKKDAYDAFVLDITGPDGKLEHLKEQHRTIWGDIAGAVTGAMKTAGEAVGTFITEKLINGLFKELGKLTDTILPGVGSALSSVFGSGAGAAGSAASGAAGAAGGAGSGAAGAVGSGVMGAVGAIGSVVSAISGVIGNFQMAGMNKTLDLIEEQVRYSQIHLKHILEDDLNVYLPKLKDIHDWLGDVFTPSWQTHMTTTENIRDSLRWDGFVCQRLDTIAFNTQWTMTYCDNAQLALGEIRDGLAQRSTNVTINVNGAQSPAATASAIDLKLQGAFI